MARRDIQGCRILITGASQGIGKALAELAAARGARVLAAARSLDLLEEVARQARARGQTLEVVQADVTSAEDRQKMVDAAVAHFGGLDVLVNNAGIGATGHFAEAGPERLRKIMVNSFKDVLRYTESHGVSTRTACYMLAIDRVASVHRLRGIYA